MAKKSASVEEYGDFQTPPELASQVCRRLADRGTNPASILEPTCGIGNFLLAAVRQFPDLSTGLGIDVNDGYVAVTKAKLAGCSAAAKVNVIHESFFEVDWPKTLGDLAEPILVVGNPPWVTNSALGTLGSSNLPDKSNFHNRTGLEAMTGKSNFDISEWMLMKLLDMLSGRLATLGMLCKTAVARKVLVHAWENDVTLSDAEIHPIDAMESFGAAVDAVCWSAPYPLQARTGIAGSIGNWGITAWLRPSATMTISLSPMLRPMNVGSTLGGKKFTNGGQASNTTARRSWNYGKWETS